MVESHKKLGLPAQSRTLKKEVSDDNGHLWAVSYADLLMVLLSFFIIFFSVDDADRKSIIRRILASDLSAQTRSLGEGKGKSLASQPRMGGFLGILRSGELGVSMKQEGTSILLLFPENVFERSGTSMLPEHKQHLKDIIKNVIPYADQVNLTFIGSTDDSPVVNKSRYIQNNFDISALRANRAMMIAAEEGFPLSGLRMKASANYERASRTLSIQISPKESE